jgi:glycosyltransferase involved in cell wall biosynthesis
MEAMASGVPVISTRTGGIPELLGENSEFGICVEEKSPGQLAKAINDLLTSRSLRESYAARGRERVLEKFDNRKNTRALYEMMAKAAAAG